MYQVSLTWQGASCKQHDESYDTFFHLISGSISLAAVCLLSHKSRLTTWRFFLLSPYCLALSLLSYPAGQNGDRTHTSRSFRMFLTKMRARTRRIVTIPYAFMFWCLVLSAYLPALRSSTGELSA